jgi:hypothetical protein
VGIVLPCVAAVKISVTNVIRCRASRYDRYHLMA